MKENTLQLRRMIREMAPVQAIPYVQSFQLPLEEERAIIEMDCRGKSRQQIAMEQHVSPETIKRRRDAGLRKICNALGMK